jgi:VanZ family protein
MIRLRRFLSRLPPYGRRWWPAIAWMAALFALSSRTGGELDGWLPAVRRMLPWLGSFDPFHYVAYSVLALLFAFALGRGAYGWRGAGKILLLCLAYGLFDEWHQSFVPGRTADARDVRNDMIGAVLAVAVLHLVRYLARRPRGLR